MAHTTLGITGATGRIGGAVSRRLEERGVAHRLLVRSPHRVASHVAAANGLLDAATMDFADPDGAAESMAGLDTVFLVSASESADRKQQQLAMVEALSCAARETRCAKKIFVTSPAHLVHMGPARTACSQGSRTRSLWTTRGKDDIPLWITRPHHVGSCSGTRH